MRKEVATRLATALAALGAAAAAAAAGAPPAAQFAAACAAAAVAAFALPRPDGAAPALPSRAPDSSGAELSELGLLALERLPRAVVIIDEGGRIVLANTAARDLFERLRPGEHYSATFRAPDFLDALDEALRLGVARRFDFNLHGDRARVIEAHVAGDLILPRPDGAPPARCVACLFEDRTHEARLARMRTDFVANASHELRTPLASVKGFIETLLGPARDDPAARERFLAIMLAQTERMARLIDDLLSLSRIELNEHVPPSELQNLGTLARETAEAMGPMAERRGTEIETDLPETGPTVRGDRDQLCQAIGNLIENALKYGGGRPVRVALRRAPADRPGMVGLAVADRGEGIAREHLPRLTERFYRVSAKRSRDEGGTGLGLAIVKHILTRHRGELQVESAPGEGAVFTLWLPELREVGDGQAPPPPRRAVATGN